MNNGDSLGLAWVSKHTWRVRSLFKIITDGCVSRTPHQLATSLYRDPTVGAGSNQNIRNYYYYVHYQSQVNFIVREPTKLQPKTFLGARRSA
jgi:hypothetical protein